VYGEERLQNVISENRKNVEKKFLSKPLHEKLRDQKMPELKKLLDDIFSGFWNVCNVEKVFYFVCDLY